jgi:hypothetical protein
MSEAFKAKNLPEEKATESSSGASTTAALWLSVLTICLFASAVLTKRDALNRSALESLSQRTAVGDDKTYPFLEPRPPEVRLKRTLLIIHTLPEVIRDSEMLLVAKSDDGEYALYAPKQRTSNPSEPDEGPWYVKTGTNSYLRATTKPDQPIR